jgi:hypothetical protein
MLYPKFRFALVGVFFVFLLSGCGGGGSSSSGTTVVSIPTGVTAEANGAKGVTLNWTSVANASGYNLYRSSTPNSLLGSMTKVNATPISNGAVSYIDTGLSPGTIYYYKIAATVGGNDNPSLEVSATTKSANPLIQMGGSIQGSPLTLIGTVSNITSGLNSATFVTTDGQSIYVSDQGSRSILKVNPITGVATVLLGNNGCTAVLCSPRGLTTDGANLYVVDETFGEIKKIVLSTGISSNYLSGFSQPNAITTDGVNLFVADLNGIHKVNLNTNTSTILTSTKATDLTTDGNSLYIIDAASNSAVNKLDMTNGTVSLFAGSAGNPGTTDGTGTQARLRNIRSITTDGTTLYLASEITSGELTARSVEISNATVRTIPNIVSALGITTDGQSIFYTSRVSNGFVLNKYQ